MYIVISVILLKIVCTVNSVVLSQLSSRDYLCIETSQYCPYSAHTIYIETSQYCPYSAHTIYIETSQYCPYSAHTIVASLKRPPPY